MTKKSATNGTIIPASVKITSKTLMNLRIKKVLLQVQIMNSSIYMNSYISEQLSIVIHFTVISILVLVL